MRAYVRARVAMWLVSRGLLGGLMFVKPLGGTERSNVRHSDWGSAATTTVIVVFVKCCDAVLRGDSLSVCDSLDDFVRHVYDSDSLRHHQVWMSSISAF